MAVLECDFSGVLLIFFRRAREKLPRVLLYYLDLCGLWENLDKRGAGYVEICCDIDIDYQIKASKNFDS
nr:MAG TPA: hypothetical protein [Caudoviricetes sp.]